MIQPTATGGLVSAAGCGWCKPIPASNTMPVPAVVDCICLGKRACDSPRCPEREDSSDPFAIRIVSNA